MRGDSAHSDGAILSVPDRSLGRIPSVNVGWDELCVHLAHTQERLKIRVRFIVKALNGGLVSILIIIIVP